MDTLAVFYLMYWKCVWVPNIYNKHTNVIIIPITLKLINSLANNK